MTETNGRIRVDPQDLTLAEYAAIETELGEPIDALLAGTGKWRAMAAMVWVLKRRTDPDYSLDDALGLRMRDIEMIAETDDQAADPLGLSATPGTPPPPSRAPGLSTPSP